MNNSEIILKFQEEIEQLKKLVASSADTIRILNEQLAWLKKQLFGKRSEKIIESSTTEIQLTLFEIPKEEVVTKTKTVEQHQRKQPNRNGQTKIDLPDDLPVEKILLDLPENEKVCQETGVPLIKIGDEISRKLAHKPGSYYIKEFIRPKYAHPKQSEKGVKTAELPEFLLNRTQVDNSFLAHLLVQKYCDHLPLYRISEILSRENIQISRQLLSQWTLKSAEALRPIYNEMRKQVLSNEAVFIDESPVKMLDPGEGSTKLTYIWVLCGGKGPNPPYRVYSFKDNRRHENAEALLKGFEGIVHSDKYGAYVSLAQKNQFTWCPCWSHIRRKFFEAEQGDTEFRDMVLNLIRELYDIEKTAWELLPEERLRMRQEKSVPIIDQLTFAIKDKLENGRILPRSNFKEALNYYISLISYLKNYTLSPWAHIDNNPAERAIRPLAIGRKNWLFFGNNEGGEAAAILLSIVQTCRALKINPEIYLEDVMSKIMSYNSQKLSDLMPDNWLKTQI